MTGQFAIALGKDRQQVVTILTAEFLTQSWAYERSAAQYAAVRQSLGEPDPFRLKYRTELRDTDLNEIFINPLRTVNFCQFGRSQ